MIFRRQQRRFLVIDEAQFILVEPDTTKLGWGVVKFVARLQVRGFPYLLSIPYLLFVIVSITVRISNLGEMFGGFTLFFICLFTVGT